MVKISSRRDFIKGQFKFALLFFGLVQTACRPEKRSDANAGEAATTVDPCDDLSGLSEEELKPRKSFGYVPESPLEESKCSNCKLWIPDQANETCGKCLLFKGPVYAAGYCTYWAPQT